MNVVDVYNTFSSSTYLERGSTRTHKLLMKFLSCVIYRRMWHGLGDFRQVANIVWVLLGKLEDHTVLGKLPGMSDSANPLS